MSLDQHVSAEDDHRVRFEVLGRLRVLDGPAPDQAPGPAPDQAPGRALRLGGARQQLVLAVLLARANTVVPTDALVDDVWGTSPPAAARHTVQGYVSELRKLLGPVIARDGPGYVVHADELSLDALEFEALVRRGRDTLPGDPAAASTSLTAALRLWRGEAFEGLDDADAVVSERVRLEQLRLTVVEERVGADLALGRHRQVVAELEGLTREHPFHEGLRAQHMLALYRSGRQADALRAFQQARTGLVEELGLEPTPLLRRLEEQVLVQDPGLDLVPDGGDTSVPAGAANPYVGLRAFTEADAGVFHGRDGLVTRLADAVRGPGGLTALVGPSGSGKSSIVQAGVVPAVRGPSGPGTGRTIALMRPGANPFTELEAALVRAVETPAVSLGLLWRPEADLVPAVLGLLPETGSLLLVVDQFEELFTLVDDRQRDAFLRGLGALATGAPDRCHILVTLRADFYDRPLGHPTFGRLMSGRVVDVLPLAPDELEAAALVPAAAAGATFERGLLGALVADVSGQPNALPLFQYTLSELFDRRSGSLLTLAAYQALGGIRGAVAQGAEEVYQRLDEPQQQATHQLFLRLVSVHRDSETRRVVTASELVALDVDTVTMHGAVEAFVAARLLVRDRDSVTGALTVEVAHEALLAEWERLRGWVDEGRDDLREHAVLTLALEDWLTAGGDPDYLLTGARLERFERWASTTGMRLTTAERDFLDQARRRRDDAVAAELARTRQQGLLRRRARRRAFVLGAGAAATAAVVVAAALVTASTAERPVVAIATSLDLTGGDPGPTEQGLVRAERDFDLVVDRHDLLPSAAAVVTGLATDGTDLAILDVDVVGSLGFAPEDLDPGSRYVLMDYDSDRFEDLPHVTSYLWADEHAGYLAGVAAASSSRTGTVAFLGTSPGARGQEDYRAGFEAGARATDPATEVLAAYLTWFGYRQDPDEAPEGGRLVAETLYDAGADVVFHVAGSSGDGVLEAATSLSADHRWVIGAETDQWQTATSRERPHVLTSVLRRVDLQIYGIISDHLDGTLEPGGHRLTPADGMITYSASGGALSEQARSSLDRAAEQLASGAVRPPRAPTGDLVDPSALLRPGTGASFFAGARDVPVTYDLPDGWAADDVFVWDRDGAYGLAFFDVANIYADPCEWVLLDPPPGPPVEDLVEALVASPHLEAGPASDVVVDGYEGSHLELTVPAYDVDSCRDGLFGLAKEDGPLGVSNGDHPDLWAHRPNQNNEVWVLDVDGSRLVILSATFPDSPPQDRADLAEMFRSIQIG